MSRRSRRFAHAPQRRRLRSAALLPLMAGTSIAAAACGAAAPAARVQRPAGAAAGRSASGAHSQTLTATTSSTSSTATARLMPLAKPAEIAVPRGAAARGEGVWRPAGRRVQGTPAVYETTVTPPGGTQPAGIAWMDTRLLSARLYSGSESPGGGPYRYTAPIRPGIARYLVAAFNGGFKMESAEGGYYAEGRTIDPLRAGAASLVIYADGSIDVGAWGSDLRMTPGVRAVRQNLAPLVADGRPTALAASADWQAWGATCGASSCTGEPGIESQWRSAVGIRGDGALVYVQGPALSPLQLAQLLVRAGARRGMELDINPDWPIFATYNPRRADGRASAANGRGLLAGTVRSPGTFFEAWWARDFIAVSARHPPV